ncbi:hypothetical protein ACWDFL_12660 [Streptomyces bungoensis]
MSKAHTARAAAAFVLAAAALAGCGSEDASGKAADARRGPSATPPARAVQDAYGRTVAAGTAKLAVSSKVVADGQALTAHGSGVADLKRGASRIELTTQGTTIEQRVVDGVVYQKPSGGQRGAVPHGKTWLRIDLDKLARQGSAGQSRVSDPAEPVRYLRDAVSGQVTRVGAQILDGTRTTHYTVTVPLSVLTRGDAGQARELGRQLGRSSLPVDVWLDGRGRMRQESVRLTLHPLEGRTPGQGSSRVTSTTVLRFGAFGTDARITAPPAADTADITDRMTKSGGTTATS